MSEWLPGTTIGTGPEKCYKVFAYTNGKKENVIVSTVAIAAEQGKVFMRAGHKEFSVEPVWIMVDGKGEYVAQENGRRVTRTVHQEAISSRYTRADIYPGIDLWKYDRDVLRRPRATVEETVYLVFGQLLFGALLAYLAILQPVWSLGNMFHVGNEVKAIALVAGGLLGASWVGRQMTRIQRKMEKRMRIRPIEEWRAN